MPTVPHVSNTFYVFLLLGSVAETVNYENEIKNDCSSIFFLWIHQSNSINIIKLKWKLMQMMCYSQKRWVCLLLSPSVVFTAAGCFIKDKVITVQTVNDKYCKLENLCKHAAQSPSSAWPTWDILGSQNGIKPITGAYFWPVFDPTQ